MGVSALVPTTRVDGTVNSTANKSADLPVDHTLIAIPSHPDTLFPLLMQRMSPLWVPRQAHRVEGGASFEINDWKIRLGELKISGGQGQGRSRGCICEIELHGEANDDEREDEFTEEIATAFFKGLVEGSGVDIGKMRVIGKVPGREHELARQYMELLTFARS